MVSQFVQAKILELRCQSLVTTAAERRTLADSYDKILGTHKLVNYFGLLDSSLQRIRAQLSAWVSG